MLSKEALLGASDLTEREVDLRPHIEGSVRVRSLPASYSNEASSASLEMVTDPQTGRQTAKADTAKLEELQVLHGLVDPKLESIEEVRLLSHRLGASWQKIIRTINEISGITEEDFKRTEQLFLPGGHASEGVSGANGVASGGAGSDLPVPAGA